MIWFYCLRSLLQWIQTILTEIINVITRIQSGNQQTIHSTCISETLRPVSPANCVLTLINKTQILTTTNRLFPSRPCTHLYLCWQFLRLTPKLGRYFPSRLLYGLPKKPSNLLWYVCQIVDLVGCFYDSGLKSIYVISLLIVEMIAETNVMMGNRTNLWTSHDNKQFVQKFDTRKTNVYPTTDTKHLNPCLA